LDGYFWQANESLGSFCSGYDYEGCKNDPECVWCVERNSKTGSGAGCLHLNTAQVRLNHLFALQCVHLVCTCRDGGVAQWLGRWSLAGELSVIYD